MNKDLSLSTLADQLKTGKDDELDLTKIAPDLSAKLGLRPDPRLVATLLKTAERKDLARDLLPAVLNVYMAQKSAAKARVSGEEQVSSLGTQSVLYLQLILHLLDAFDMNGRRQEYGESRQTSSLHAIKDLDE